MSLLLSSYYAEKTEFPVFEIFKAIYLLQTLEGVEEEVQSLSTKLEGYFAQIKDYSGAKIYGNLRYLPSGLCYASRDTNVAIVLSPWESDYNKEVRREETNKHYGMYGYTVQRFGTFYPSMMFKSAGKRFVMHKFDPIKIYQAMLQYNSLPEGAKVAVNFDSLARRVISAVHSLHSFFDFTLTYEDNKYNLTIPNQEECQAMYKLLSSSENTWKGIDALGAILKAHNLTDDIPGEYTRYTYRIDYEVRCAYYSNRLRQLYEVIDAVEDKLVRSLFKRAGII